MKKKPRLRKRTLIGIALLGGWVLAAPYSCTFTIRDATAIKEFDSAGVPLHTGFYTIQDCHLHFATTGAAYKPTIVFIHGSPGSWTAFEQYLKDTALLQRYLLVSIDRPGFGQSNFGKALPLQPQAAIIAAFLDSISNGLPLYLVGHSLGGPLVVKLAAMLPAHLKGIVVLSGSIDAAEEKPEKWRPVLFKTPLNLLVPGAFRPSNEELWYLKKDLKELVPDFEKITCAVYLVHGTKDNMVPYHNMTWGATMFTHVAAVKMFPIAGANHFIPWQHYSEIRQVLLSLPE